MPDATTQVTPTVEAEASTATPTTKPAFNSLGDAIAAGLAKAGKPSLSTSDSDEPEDATQEPSSATPQTSAEQRVASSDTPELPETGSGMEPDNLTPDEVEPSAQPDVEPSPDVDSRYRELESRYIELEPRAQAYDSIANFLQESRVSNEDFQSAMLALKARAEGDYATFQKHLAPWLDEVKSVTGDALPPELAKLVESGECTPEVAKRLAAAEAQRQVVAKNAERAAEHAARQAEQARLAGMMKSFGDWLSVRQKSDTSFKPKAGPNARDGAYEYFLLKLNAEVPKAGIKDAASLAQLADRIYREASAMFPKAAPNGAAKVLRGTTATAPGGREKVPTSLAEAVRMGIARAGKRQPNL